MAEQEKREYRLSINPRILELLGPSLYTNIYYILAELIANAYDADAQNVYIISSRDRITVEDDGKGMSYSGGDITKYLDVAAVSRRSENDSQTPVGRSKMGRKGVGKLAALSVSDTVLIKTISNGEKSGFTLTRNIGEDNLLPPLNEDQIVFEKISTNGTAVVMQNPQYRLHQDLGAIKRNLLKIFPLVNETFKIHIIRGREEVVVGNFDQEMIKELATLITIGNDFQYLDESFETPFQAEKSQLLSHKEIKIIPIEMANISGEKHEYNVEISGWIGTYKSTRGRRATMTDFPDNFISLYANKKMGEFNTLPAVSQNKLPEVYVVGQLHVDIFELTELPDMALSNRQGYKTDDPRYQAVMSYIREELLSTVLSMRDLFVKLGKRKKDEKKIEDQKNDEAALRRSVDLFRMKTSRNAANRINERIGITETQQQELEKILSDEIDLNSPDMGLKRIVDSQKKKILISQTYLDKGLADVVYAMLLYNGVPPEDILYTNCDDEVARVPVNYQIYDYLREFFVNSYSTQKIYVIFVTSDHTKESWGALIEVGAAWITEIEHKIFNINTFRPEHPLNDELQWHSTSRDVDGNLSLSKLSQDIFAQYIEYICDIMDYSKKTRSENKTYLATLLSII